MHLESAVKQPGSGPGTPGRNSNSYFKCDDCILGGFQLFFTRIRVAQVVVSWLAANEDLLSVQP